MSGLSGDVLTSPDRDRPRRCRLTPHVPRVALAGVLAGIRSDALEGSRMDSDRFDALSRSLATVGTRRGLMRLLGALPLLGALMTVLDDEKASARRRRKAQRQRADKPERQRADNQKKQRASTSRRCKEKSLTGNSVSRRRRRRSKKRRSASRPVHHLRLHRSGVPRPPVPPRARTAARSRTSVETNCAVDRTRAATATPVPTTAASVWTAPPSAKESAARRGRSVRTPLEPAARRRAKTPPVPAARADRPRIAAPARCMPVAPRVLPASPV